MGLRSAFSPDAKHVKVPAILAPAAHRPTRLVALDALRGVAAILMVQQHLGVWLVGQARDLGPLRTAWISLNMTGGVAAPLFVTLSGVGVALAAQRGTAGTRQVRRGVGLLLWGLALNLMVPSWFSWGSFYVLHLLGTWLVVSPLATRLKGPAIAVAIGVVLGVAVLGQSWLETPLKLTNPMMRDVSKPGGVLRLAFFEGQFPIFPWLALALGGLLAGRAIAAGQSRRLLWGAALCAVVVVLARLPVAFVDHAARVLPYRALCRVSFFPLSTLHAALLFGVSLALLFACVKLQDGRKAAWLSWLVPFGRTSLTLLVVHVVLFREGSRAWGYWWTMSPLQGLFVIVAFLALWGILARAWAKVDYRYGLEWSLRQLG